MRTSSVSTRRTARQIISARPSARILILTSYGTSDALRHALSAGALGVVLKSAAFTDLIAGIHAVADGREFLSADIRRILSADAPVPRLSPRQGEILGALARGLSNAEIARLLNIGPDMVKQHLNALFQKLGAANRTEAVAIALRKHLLKT